MNFSICYFSPEIDFMKNETLVGLSEQALEDGALCQSQQVSAITEMLFKKYFPLLKNFGNVPLL